MANAAIQKQKPKVSNGLAKIDVQPRYASKKNN